MDHRLKWVFCGRVQKWQDIIKEVKFLQKLRHPNTIEYRGCYLKEHTAWVCILVSCSQDAKTFVLQKVIHNNVTVCVLSFSWWWSTVLAQPQISLKVSSTTDVFFFIRVRFFFSFSHLIFSLLSVSHPFSSQKATAGNRNSCYHPWCAAGTSISPLSQHDSQVTTVFFSSDLLLSLEQKIWTCFIWSEFWASVMKFELDVFFCRDVKAGNILLTEPGQVKLGDFGSASIVSPANSFVGTPYWWASLLVTFKWTLYFGLGVFIFLFLINSK